MTYLTARDVSERMSVSKTTALGIMREAGAIKIGRLLRLSVEDFDRWLAKRSKPTETVSFAVAASIIAGSRASGGRRAAGRAKAVVPQCAEVVGWVVRELAGLR